MPPSFANQIYAEVKSLFAEGEVEALLCKAKDAAGCSAAVRLIHKPSGMEVVCEDFSSQTENYIAAALRLRIQCDSGRWK
jgi:hypothetical protein